MLTQAKLDPADVAGSVRKLVQAKTAAETATQLANDEKQAALAARDTAEKAQQSTEEAKKALEADLKSTREQLAAMKPTGEPKPNVDAAELTKLRDEKAKLEEQLTAANQARDAQRLSAENAQAFAKSVRQKLQAASNADASEVLTALDQALAAKNQPRELPPLPAGFYTVDPRGEQVYASGLANLRVGRYAEAEANFRAAVGFNDRDARYYYFLGLAELYQGRSTEAESDFRQGAERERRNLPNPSTIDSSLERWPVDVRATLNRARGRG